MNQRGYSLLEVMISMVVLGIAFLAIIATQIGTLNGYVSARDSLQAAELGRRTVEILKIQGSQWITNFDDSDASTVDTFNPVDVYDSSGVTPFDEANPIATMLASATAAWIPLVNDPVDGRFMRTSVNANHLGGKYCIFAKGADIAPQFDDFGGDPVAASIRFQVAVVYPGSRASLTDCTSITEAQLNNVGDPTATPFVPPPLETAGLRVSYTGGILVRRAHLTNFAAGNP